MVLHTGPKHGYPSPSNCSKTVFAFIALTIAIFAVYSNSFNAGWHFDDFPNIYENPRLHMEQLSWGNLKKAVFSDPKNPQFPYRPIACLSFALNYYVGGLNVLGYHLVNVLVHLVASLFLFLLTYRTLCLPLLKEKYSSQAYGVALVSTFLWALNPIQTQAVTYIVQRMAAMAAMFFIMGIYFYMGARTSVETWKKGTRYGLCFLCFLLALGSKENAAMFPVGLLLYEVLFLQEEPRYFLKRHWTLLVAAISLTALIGTAYFLFKAGRLPDLTASYQNRPFTLWERLLTEPRVILFYISLIFYPMPNRLSITHDFKVSTSLSDPLTTIPSIAIIIAATVGAVLLSRKSRALSFSILFFLANHLIESSVLSLELVFEHRNYLPSMFLMLPVASGLLTLIDHYKQTKIMKYVVCGFLVLILVGFGHSTFMRNFVWKNELSLWVDAVDKAPDLFRPHHNLGNAYHKIGDLENAEAEYIKALSKRVTYSKYAPFITYYNLGKLAQDRKRYEEAISFYQKSISLNPNFSSCYVNLAVVYDIKGEIEKANQFLIKALELSPGMAAANYNMGLHCLRMNELQMAIRYLSKALSYRDFEVPARKLLGIAYKKMGRNGLATVNFRKVLAKDPGHIATRFHLAEIYYKAGRTGEAKFQIIKVLKALKSRTQFRKTIKEIFHGEKRQRSLAPDWSTCRRLLLEVMKERAKELNSWVHTIVQESSSCTKLKKGSKA